MIHPGRRNSLADVAGIAVGNAQDERLASGVTVVLADVPAVGAVDVRGGAPGTRETDLLAPGRLVEEVDAVVLSGGSAFGLEAAAGIAADLAVSGRGFAVAGHRVPIVPSAILFDLANGGDKDWGATPPYRELGRKALAAAGQDFAFGNVGAGTGATAGSLKGGLGSASFLDEESGISVAALAVVNSLGEVTMPGCEAFWAWPYEQADEFGGIRPDGCTPAFADPLRGASAGENTTLVVVATDARLDRSAAGRFAVMAHDGIAVAIRPAHTPYDGDTVFALSTRAGRSTARRSTIRRA